MSGWCPALSASAATPLTKNIASLKLWKRYVRASVLLTRLQPGVFSSAANSAAWLRPGRLVAPGGRSRARGLAGVEDDRWIHGVAADVVQQARELQLLVGARGPRELGALQRVLQLRHSLAAVEARRGARHGVEQPVGHRAHSRANFCSERISRGGVSLLPCAVQDTSP